MTRTPKILTPAVLALLPLLFASSPAARGAEGANEGKPSLSFLLPSVWSPSREFSIHRDVRRRRRWLSALKEIGGSWRPGSVSRQVRSPSRHGLDRHGHQGARDAIVLSLARARPQLRMRAMSCRSQKPAYASRQREPPGRFMRSRPFPAPPAGILNTRPRLRRRVGSPMRENSGCPRFSWRGCTWMSEGISSERSSWRVYRSHLALQVQRVPLAPDRRPGMADRDKEISEVDTVGSWRKETMGDGQPTAGSIRRMKSARLLPTRGTGS